MHFKIDLVCRFSLTLVTDIFCDMTACEFKIALCYLLDTLTEQTNSSFGIVSIFVVQVDWKWFNSPCDGLKFHHLETGGRGVTSVWRSPASVVRGSVSRPSI